MELRGDRGRGMGGREREERGRERGRKVCGWGIWRRLCLGDGMWLLWLGRRMYVFYLFSSPLYLRATLPYLTLQSPPPLNHPKPKKRKPC